MTRARRIANMVTEYAYVINGTAFVSRAVLRRINRELSQGLVRLPEGVTIEATANIGPPVPIKRAKKIVRRIHRARLANKGKPWV